MRKLTYTCSDCDFYTSGPIDEALDQIANHDDQHHTQAREPVVLTRDDVRAVMREELNSILFDLYAMQWPIDQLDTMRTSADPVIRSLQALGPDERGLPVGHDRDRMAELRQALGDLVQRRVSGAVLGFVGLKTGHDRIRDGVDVQGSHSSSPSVVDVGAHSVGDGSATGDAVSSPVDQAARGDVMRVVIDCTDTYLTIDGPLDGAAVREWDGSTGQLIRVLRTPTTRETEDRGRCS